MVVGEIFPDQDEHGQCIVALHWIIGSSKVESYDETIRELLKSCDDGIPRYQDQDQSEFVLDIQDQGADFYRQNQEPASRITQGKMEGIMKQWILMIFKLDISVMKI